ncbi:hypothetical protein PVAND_017802, partial [Polypedilum vanderplanki]
MDPNLLSSTATDDMNALRIADSNRPAELVPGPSELSDRHLPEETLLDSTDAVRFAPGEGENPIPMYMDPYCEELAFPTIWFGHPRGVPPKGVRLSFLDHINSEIRRFDRRACRPDHILFLHKKAQIEQLTKQVNIVLRKSAQTNNITAAQVRNKQFIDNAVNNDSAYRFMTRQNSARRSRREDLEYLHNESERDKLTQRKRRSIRESWAKALETYNKNIKDGPFHRCYSCDRLFFANKINTTDRDSLMKNNDKITDEFLDSIVLPELLVDVEYSFCST